MIRFFEGAAVAGFVVVVFALAFPVWLFILIAVVIAEALVTE